MPKDVMRGMMPLGQLVTPEDRTRYSELLAPAYAAERWRWFIIGIPGSAEICRTIGSLTLCKHFALTGGLGVRIEGSATCLYADKKLARHIPQEALRKLEES